MSEISFADLRCRFQTGRSFIISGEGRNRIYGYRNGVQCALGDLERSQWCELARDLVDRKGEQDLHKQLLQYLKDHNYAKVSIKELEFHALELHMDRIFDNERWLGFVEFNQQYRPEILTATRLILIKPECCKKAGLITRTRYEENQEDNFCPHCGRWTKISLIEAEIDSN